ncbi:MlaD family protein [Nocardia goodfellowii]
MTIEFAGRATGARYFTLGAEEAPPRAQLLWAMLTVVVLTIAATGIGVAYLHPLGTSTYHLRLPESGGLKSGDGVRIAGVTVGRVLSLRLEEDYVAVEFSVDSTQRLGDRTAVDVRMLTPVGGLYLTLSPAGSAPLRDAIPVDRAQLPYLVNELVPKAAELAEQVDMAALRTALAGVADGLTDAPGAVRDSVSDLESVVTVLATQKQQVEGLLALSNEYLVAARKNQELATEVIRAYAILGPQIVAARSKVEIFADKMTAVVGLLFDFLSGPYAEKVEPLLFPLEQTRNLSGELLDSTNSVIDSMLTTLTKLAQLAGPEGRALIDQSQLAVRPLEVCIPTPGTRC